MPTNALFNLNDLLNQLKQPQFAQGAQAAAAMPGAAPAIPATNPAAVPTAAGTTATPTISMGDVLHGTAQPTATPATTNPTPGQAFTDYWKKPVVAGIPRDRFVNLAGMIGQAFAPNTPMGRLGGALSKQGQAAYNERMKRAYEAPDKALARKINLANLAKAQTPTTENRYIDTLMKQINPKTGKTYTMPEAYAAYKTVGAKPTKPEYHYTKDANGNISVFANGKLLSGSGKGAPVKDSSKYNFSTNDKGAVTVFKNGKQVSTTQPGVGKTNAKKGETAVKAKVRQYKLAIQGLIPGDKTALIDWTDPKAVEAMLNSPGGKSVFDKLNEMANGTDKGKARRAKQALSLFNELTGFTPPPAPTYQIQRNKTTGQMRKVWSDGRPPEYFGGQGQGVTAPLYGAQ